MAIPTTRTTEEAQILFNTELCRGCGLCVSVCKDFSLEVVDGKATKSKNAIFGCIGCGHCMAICPNGAIKIEGRFTSGADLFPIPRKEEAASFGPYLKLLQRRRSIREFKDKPVEMELIHKILEAASQAPMGLPPSDVNVLVMDTPEKVRKFSFDFCDYLKGLRWMTSGWFLTLARPFWGKENDLMFRNFVKQMIDTFISAKEKGENLVTYDAPAAFYFYGSPYTDPADPIVVATYAMLAAESLGLGTCMLGGVHPFIQSGSAAAKFRKDHGIRYKSREGLILIIGYPAVKYKMGIARSFANVDFV
ncbi:MAG: nitroreductase family protein [Bacteroidia bacterium]|nr:nitroreductase family protein [Bacteroidia bacterium]